MIPKPLRKPIDWIRSGPTRWTIPFRITVAGVTIRWIPLASVRGYEPDTTALLRRIVKKGDICIDAGANIGYFTVLMSELVGDSGMVYAFEPATKWFRKLEKNTCNLENVKVYKCGLGNNPASVRFSIDSNSVFNINGGTKSENVKIVRLDDELKGRVNVIKADIEGFEPEMIDGMRRIMNENPNLKIVIEIAPKLLNKIGRLATAVLDRFVGYQLHTIDGTPLTREEMKTFLSSVGATNIFVTKV